MCHQPTESDSTGRRLDFSSCFQKIIYFFLPELKFKLFLKQLAERQYDLYKVKVLCLPGFGRPSTGDLFRPVHSRN